MEPVEDPVAEFVQSPSEEPGPRSGPPGCFQKGDDPRRLPIDQARQHTQAAKRKIPPPPEVIVSEEGVDPSLASMRHVDVNHRSYDRTERHRTARKLKDDSPEKFLTLLMKMEEAHRIRTSAVSGNGEKDLGEARARELIEKLLAEFAEGKR